MMLRRLISSILLIGFLFTVFHDFVFYEVDPCMDTVQSLTVLDDKNISSNDPLCDLHQKLHMEYTFVKSLELKQPAIVSSKNPANKNLHPKHIINLPFKPPAVV